MEVSQVVLGVVVDVAVTVIVTLVLGLVSYLAVALAGARHELVGWIRVKLGEPAAEHVDWVLDMAVRAAQDARVSGKIEDLGMKALIYAMLTANEELGRRGIEIDPMVLENLVRARYQELYGTVPGKIKLVRE